MCGGNHTPAFLHCNDAVFILSTHARTLYTKARITFTRFYNQYTFGTPKHPSEKTPEKLLAYPLRYKHKRMFFTHMYHTTKLFPYVFFVPNAYQESVTQNSKKLQKYTIIYEI